MRCCYRCNSKRSRSILVLGEELSDCIIGRKLLDAREHLVPRLAAAERVQQQAVLRLRRTKSFQSVGGAAPLDELKEAVVLERIASVEQQDVDIVVVAEAALGGPTFEEHHNTLTGLRELSAGGSRLIRSLMTLMSSWFVSAWHRGGLPTAPIIHTKSGAVGGFPSLNTCQGIYQ